MIDMNKCMFLDFIEERIRHLLKCPEMYGGLEAVELQFYLLIEFRRYVLGGVEDFRDNIMEFTRLKTGQNHHPMSLCCSDHSTLVLWLSDFYETEKKG